MRVEAVHFNGGFGRADKLVSADILSPSGDAAGLIAAEDALLAEINAAEGLDLSAGGASARVDFAAPAFEPDAWRRRLGDALGASSD